MAAHVVSKRRNGNTWWYVREHLGGGRYKWHSGFASRADAQAFLQTLGTDPLRGAGVGRRGDTRTRFRARAEAWLAEQDRRVEAGTLRPKSADFYRGLLECHAIPQMGDVPLAKVGPERLDRLYADLRKAGVRATTLHHLHRTLHKFFADLVRRGVAGSNPCGLVDPPRRAQSEAAVWTEEQALGFLGEAKRSSRLHPLYLTAIASGLRQGELLALDWPHVDAERGVLGVVRSVARMGKRIVWGEPKSRASRRAVVVPPAVAAELRALRKAQVAERLRRGLCAEGEACREQACPRWHELDLVFCQENGKPLHAHNVAQRDFRRIMVKAGLPRISFHGLRRLHGSLLVRRGVDVATVSSRLGHHSKAFTLQVYVSELADAEDLAARAIGGMLAAEAK